MTNSDDLSLLKQQILACQLCQANLPLPAKPIIQLANQARILIAGQAPGQKAHDLGIPFQDPSGIRLREWLGVSEQQFYDENLFAILPMGFCFPGTSIKQGKKNGDKPPLALCANTWRASVIEALPHIELIIVLGQYAIDFHIKQNHITKPAFTKAKSPPKPTTKLSVTEAVMNWQAYWPSHIVLPHPSPRNNIWIKRHPQFETDILPRLKQRVAEIISL